jgi:tetratricopeptide (TPR) repeat protein
MNPREGDAAARSAGIDPNSAAPSAPDEFVAIALKQLQAGQVLEAQLSCQQALDIDASHADSLHLMGLVALHARQFDHAVAWLTRAIRQDTRPEYLVTLGLTLKQAGRLEEACATFDTALRLKPEDAELWKALGAVLAALNRPDDALLAYQRAMKLNPRHWEAAYHCGNLLHQTQRFEQALAHFNLANWLQPDHVPTLFARARTQRALKRYEQCLADYQRAHALAPTDPIISNNIGDALLRLDRYQEGLDWFDKALQLRPGVTEVLVNRAFALFQLHRFGEAMAAYARATELDPNDARSVWQIAHLQLQTGDFAEGWAGREARWQVPEFAPDYPKFSQPKWLGEQDIAGKTVLICADEGLGDTLQFARYLPDLAARGARVILVVEDGLRRLLTGIPGVCECLPFTARELPPFDLHCPIMSLPLAFGTTLETIPQANYLPPLPAGRVRLWRDRLGPRHRLRVGLVWSGNPHQGNDRNRSMPFKALTPLLDLDATFVSLQKDVRPGDKALLEARTNIIDFTAELTDFAETAALIANLDLVITVCTSVAHLAATLGRPTWIMLPFVGDWRWLDGRDDSPWYPSVRLFRQDETRDYGVVIASVRAELQAMICSFKP